MAKIEKKSFEACSNAAKHIIRSTDRWFDEYTLPILVYDIDPSVDEACEAIKYITDTGWIGGTIYTKKMVYLSLPTPNSSILHTKIGLVITDNEKNFAELENGEHTYYQFIDSFPEIIGVPATSGKGDGDIKLKDKGSFIMSKASWDEKNNNVLKKDDPVILYFNNSFYETQDASPKKIVGIFTGKTIVDPETNQTLYEINTTIGSMFLEHGINCKEHCFISLPEYNLACKNLLEANDKSLPLFNKYNEYVFGKKRQK